MNKEVWYTAGLSAGLVVAGVAILWLIHDNIPTGKGFKIGKA